MYATSLMSIGFYNLDQFAKETKKDILLLVPPSESIARHFLSFSSRHVIGVSLRGPSFKKFVFIEKNTYWFVHKHMLSI